MERREEHRRPDAAWYERVVDASGLVLVALRVRPDLAFEFVSDGVATQLGLTPAQVLADPSVVLSRIDSAHVERWEQLRRLPPGDRATVEIHWWHPDGHAVYSRLSVESRQRADGSVVLEGAIRDITRLHEMEIELTRSEERHRLLVENAWDVIWTMALDGTITYVSPSVERVRGITPEEAMVQPLDQIHPPSSAARVLEYYQRLGAAIANGTEPPTFRGEQEYYRKDGSIMVGELQVIPHVDADGKVVQILGVTRDITEHKRFQDVLQGLAITDPLTGVRNRRHGQELLADFVRQAGRPTTRLSLLMLDIDEFKRINDTHGHQAGDRVLVEVAERLSGNLRSTDMLARWGGEEFVILLQNCGTPEAQRLAQKFRGLVADVPFGDGDAITVSIGVAQLEPDDDLDSWLGRADAALYEAKQAGRNTVVAAPVQRRRRRRGPEPLV